MVEPCHAAQEQVQWRERSVLPRNQAIEQHTQPQGAETRDGGFQSQKEGDDRESVEAKAQVRQPGGLLPPGFELSIHIK